MNPLSRREFLKFATAGAVVVAGELWVPGQKVISIPKPLPPPPIDISTRDYVRASYDFGRTFFKVPLRDVLLNKVHHETMGLNGNPLSFEQPDGKYTAPSIDVRAGGYERYAAKFAKFAR